MDDNTLEWFDILGKGLLWAAILVLVLSVIGGVAIGTSSSSNLPVIGEFQQQNRGTFALAAFLFGFTCSGLLAGMGALLRMNVADRRKRD